VRRNQRFSAEALRAVRLRAGLSRSEAALRVGVSEATVKGWENGTRAPKATSHAALAKALGVAFEALEQPGPADAEDLRRLRESLGLTQAEAARRMGIDASALKRVEAGAELPPDPKAMARVYGLTAGDLAAVARRTGG